MTERPLEGSVRVVAKFAHLREEQRQIQAEVRGRGSFQVMNRW